MVKRSNVDKYNDLKDTLIVIPARYASQRLKAKLLKKLNHKTILQHTYEKCLKANIGKVIIACDDKRIANEARKFNAMFTMTSKSIKTGTDRVYAAVQNRKEKYIINVQGDEPFIKPSTIQKVHHILKQDKHCDISTAIMHVPDQNKVLEDVNTVKVAISADGRAIFFSRLPIPYHRDKKTKKNYYTHFGIYGYKKYALTKFVNLKQTHLEKAEQLEQIRALENGMIIKCVKVSQQGISIDTLQDYKRAEELIKHLR